VQEGGSAQAAKAGQRRAYLGVLSLVGVARYTTLVVEVPLGIVGAREGLSNPGSESGGTAAMMMCAKHCTQSIRSGVVERSARGTMVVLAGVGGDVQSKDG
jgi:hypothetical protein